MSEQQESEIPVSEPEAATAKWTDLGSSADFLKLVKEAGFEKPSPVQAQVMPPALANRDILASAQTGSGKTLAFVAPVVEKLRGKKGTYGLILCPTREIALQTFQVMQTFGNPLGVTSIVLIGGTSVRQDDETIGTYPNVIVATPGRLCDHLDRGNIWLDYIEVLVLDEGDRMLDMGFAPQLNRIMESSSPNAQKLLFSATLAPGVESIARRFTRDAVRIKIGTAGRAAPKIDQRSLFVRDDDRFRHLLRLLDHETGSVIIFTKSKIMATQLWRSFHSRGMYHAVTIHSNMQQKSREKVLADFKAGTSTILIATDVAGRGIHVDNVAHVVNYELPIEAEEYIHRIGRTGRADASGKATSLVSNRELRKLQEIEKLLGKRIQLEGFRAGDKASASRGGRPRKRR